MPEIEVDGLLVGQYAYGPQMGWRGWIRDQSDRWILFLPENPVDDPYLICKATDEIEALLGEVRAQP